MNCRIITCKEDNKKYLIPGCFSVAHNWGADMTDKEIIKNYCTCIKNTKPPKTEVDWHKIRKMFFMDCVTNDSVDGLKIKINYAPHDLFEWFKKQINIEVKTLNK